MSTPEPRSHAEILSTAVVRAAGFFGVSDPELAVILGVDTAMIDDIRERRDALPPQSSALERAVLFTGIWVAVDTFFASQDDLSQAWLRRPSAGLCGAIPFDLMTTPEGLALLRGYAIRFEEPAEYESPIDATEAGRRVRDLAIEAFGSPAAALVWLWNPQHCLQGRIPSEVIKADGGLQEVLRVLHLIDYGDPP